MSLLIERDNGDAYYTGPLMNGLALVLIDRVIFTEGYEDVFHVEFRDFPGNSGDTAEWGRGETLDEALRWAMGAFFGPLDEFYSEKELHTLLTSDRIRDRL